MRIRPIYVDDRISSPSKKCMNTSDKNGEIKIEMHPVNKNEIELMVSDNGVGLPEMIDFRNTESLGLHLVTLLAEDQLKGEIKLDKKNGTSFHVRLKRKL